MAQLTLRDGWEWFVGGWRLFKQQPLPFMLGALAWLLLESVLLFLPFIGELVDGLLLPAAYAGFVFAAQATEQGEKPVIKTFFQGITKPEMRMATLLLGLAVVLYELLGLLFTMLVGPIGVALFAFPMGVILYAALIFAVPAVVLDNRSALAAMKMSLQKSSDNVSALLMTYLILLLLMFLSVATVGVALLVIMPLTCCSFYVGYRAVER